MPIAESLELIISTVNTHYEERSYQEWLFGSIVNSLGGGEIKTYREYIGVDKKQVSSKSIDEIRKENKDILENFFK